MGKFIVRYSSRQLSLNMIITHAKQGRFMCFGRSGKRLLSTILNKQEESDLYFVITSRDMSKKERALYRSQEGAV